MHNLSKSNISKHKRENIVIHHNHYNLVYGSLTNLQPLVSLQLLHSAARSNKDTGFTWVSFVWWVPLGPCVSLLAASATVGEDLGPICRPIYLRRLNNVINNLTMHCWIRGQGQQRICIKLESP
ncbi:hypothetical protein E2542_SST03546 [Spatholobus suberectus]|nr:hypothetical protein E2542_SST03546 [Spatholobus suberectus]